MQSENARAVADVTGGLILARVDIRAKPERVFAALSDPKDLVRWWGADGIYKTTGWTADFVVGGGWRAEGLSADDEPYFIEGEFIQIEPPHCIVMTWRADYDGGQETKLTYRMDPIEAGTRLTVRHEGFGNLTQSCESHASGWEMVMTWLRTYLESAAATDHTDEPSALAG